MSRINKTAYIRDKNQMSVPERAGEIVAIFISGLIAAFFAYHLTRNTGFMTASFGRAGTVLLFGSIALSVIASGSRAVVGRRDDTRPFELVSNVYWSVASIWFLVVFPFNFAHLADPLPLSVRFVISWITNSIGWIIILLATIGGIACSINSAVRLFLDKVHISFEKTRIN